MLGKNLTFFFSLSPDALMPCTMGSGNCMCEGEGLNQQCYCQRGFNATMTGDCIGKDVI